MNNAITEDFKLYEKGKDYNTKISYKSNCDKNERFYAGDQWYGVKANNLPTPVFNIFRRIIDYIVSYILSAPIKINVTTANKDNERAINALCSNKWETGKMDILLREMLLDGAITGDMAIHTYWDKDIYAGNSIYGDFVSEVIDGINLFFGNVNDRRVETQPYILIAGRAMTADLQREALSEGVAEQIVSDEDNQTQMGDRSSIELSGKTTFLIKYYRDAQTGRIFFNKCTKTAVIKSGVDTGLYRYPICFTNYTKRKNSYHGQALGTNLLPNQIFINKVFAMAMKHTMDTAFPKAVYDKTRVSSWNNTVGSAIGVNGDISGVASFLEPAAMGSTVITLIDRAMRYTQENMGASDVLMGQNMSPDNASAIIALQKSASIPIENVKQNLYGLVEDMALVWLEFVRAKYIVKREIISPEGESFYTGSQMLSDNPVSIKIDVGPSVYWSELASVSTLDNLLSSNQITLKQYLDRIPKGYIPKANELIEELKVAEEQGSLLQDERKLV